MLAVKEKAHTVRRAGRVRVRSASVSRRPNYSRVGRVASVREPGHYVVPDLASDAGSRVEQRMVPPLYEAGFAL